jgi:chaperonin GroES
MPAVVGPGGILAGLQPPVHMDADAEVAAADERAEPDMDLADRLKGWIESPNIAEELETEECNKIATQVLLDYELDEQSRADWKTAYEKWLKFAMQVAEEKTYPWPQASNVIYPLMTTGAVMFAARAYPAIIRDRGVVKGSVFGPDNGVPAVNPQTGQPLQGPDGAPVWQVPPGAKRARADKVGEHMSWQLLEEQEEWEPQTDKLLIILPIVGCMFRKTYFDPTMQRNVSETVTALNICVNYKAKSFETAPRVSEILQLYPHEIEERIRSGIFLEADYGFDQGSEQDLDAPVTFIEQHRRWDLDGDGYSEPYIITVAKDSHRLARIKAAYDMDGVFFSSRDARVRKIEAIAYYTRYGFIPSPDSGVYDIGFGHLLYPINAAINSSLNQLFDAGHLANAGGGFIGSNLSMNTGSVFFQVGEYKPVDVTGGNIRDAVFPLPFAGPNPVLFSLLQFLVDAGEKISAVKDVMVGEQNGSDISGVALLAMIEQGLQVFTAIYKRIHRSLKAEFKKLFRLNRLYLPLTAGYQIGSEWRTISQADYAEGAGVEPISDPRMITNMQKLGRAQFLMQWKDDPWFKPRELRLQVLDAAQFPNGDELLLTQMPPNPEITAGIAQMQLEKDALDQRERELSIRAAHQEAEMDISRGKNHVDGVLRLAQAINQLAQAAKADSESQQGWYAHKLETLRLEMDRINDAADRNSADSSPAAAGGLSRSGQGAGGVGGPVGGAVPAVAPAPGEQAGAGVPGALPGGAGGPGAEQLAGGGA